MNISIEKFISRQQHHQRLLHNEFFPIYAVAMRQMQTFSVWFVFFAASLDSETQFASL